MEALAEFTLVLLVIALFALAIYNSLKPKDTFDSSRPGLSNWHNRFMEEQAARDRGYTSTRAYLADRDAGKLRKRQVAWQSPYPGR